MSDFGTAVLAILIGTVITGGLWRFPDYLYIAEDMGTWRWWRWSGVRRRRHIWDMEHDLGLLPCGNPDCWSCDRASRVTYSNIQAEALRAGLLSVNDVRRMEGL